VLPATEDFFRREEVLPSASPPIVLDRSRELDSLPSRRVVGFFAFFFLLRAKTIGITPPISVFERERLRGRKSSISTASAAAGAAPPLAESIESRVFLAESLLRGVRGDPSGVQWAFADVLDLSLVVGSGMDALELLGFKNSALRFNGVTLPLEGKLLPL
jgi:hypothetical protein